MLAFNMPSLTLCIVQPTPETQPTKVFSVQIPSGFYEPRTLWKIEIKGKFNPDANGVILKRRLSFGGVMVSELLGVTNGNYDMLFHDTHTVLMYADNLFDVVSSGINSVGPLWTPPGIAVPIPTSAKAEVVASHSNAPASNRDNPIDLYVWAGPIASQVAVIIEQLSIFKVE